MRWYVACGDSRPLEHERRAASRLRSRGEDLERDGVRESGACTGVEVRIDERKLGACHIIVVAGRAEIDRHLSCHRSLPAFAAAEATPPRSGVECPKGTARLLAC
jgi:hypothetical protein